MAFSIKSLVWKLTAPVALITGLVIAVAFVAVPYFVKGFIHDNALFAARDTVRSITALRGYYSRFVVDVVSGRGGVEAAADHKDSPNKIPLPVTLIHDISDLVEEDGVKVRIYSPYPFPPRRERVLNDREDHIWKKLITRPDSEVVETTVEQGKTILRVAIADRMQTKSCIQCHNTRVDSPRKNWAIGDVRGVLEVSIDLTEQIAQGQLLGNWIILVILIGGILISTIIIRMTSRAVEPLAQMTDAMVSLADGDYDTPLPKSTRQDEIGAVARAVETFKLALISNREMEERDRTSMEKTIRVRTSLLMEEQERLRLIFETTMDGIIIFSDEGEIETLNEGAARMFSYDREDLLGANVGTLMPPSERKQFDKFFQEFGRTGSAELLGRENSFRGLRKNGTSFPIHVAFSHGTLGERNLFTAIMYDASDQAAREQELLEAKERAEEANRAKSEFLSAMSHELRTPMNGILGFTQMLKYAPLEFSNEKREEYIEHILSAGGHLLSLIDDVLDLAKIESGKAVFSIETLDPLDVIGESIKMVATMAENMDITIHKPTVSDGITTIKADPLRLKQVLVNLLSNAIKYNDNSGDVFIAVSAEKTFVRFTIRDTGIGIHEDALKTIGTPFHRMVDHTKPIEGTGIGLAVSRKLVALMGGNVGVESTEGEGSTFWFELPIDG